ncbi:MAG: RnfABCDGE type electron transport complex subunit D [Spirochaetaceae bacterium]|nr:MAG: RnfABCDGE type electron transport complex subunit D [Spirochaetaceae bacterium]
MKEIVRRSGPHIESRDSVRRNMWEVSAALLPAVAAAVVFFGPYALYLIFSSAIAAAILERPFTPGGFSLKRPLGDGSAFLAGLLFGLTLAPGSPWWIPLFGAALVVFVGKQAFGGIGHNVFNPALVARGILLIAYPALVTEWRVPLSYDVVTAATPLEGASASYLNLFLGNVPGSIGEVSALALLIGAAYLFARGFVGWRITVSYVVAAALTALALGLDPLFTVLSGSLMFAALFMATDMVTSPVGRSARIVYGIGCGVLTVLIRRFTVYPEGVTFAVLLMNGLTPLIDVSVVDAFFGQVEKRRQRVAAFVAAAAVVAIGVGAGFGGSWMSGFADAFYVDGTVRRDIRAFFPDARHALRYESERDSVVVEKVYQRSEPVGYLVYSSASGYKSDVRIVLALDLDERIIGLRVVDHAESATLGALVRRPSFLNQFLRRSTADPSAVLDTLHVVTGATASSRAVAEAIEQALLFRTAPAAPRARLEPPSDGLFAGSARGYGGEIRVEVTVENGAVTAIDVVSHSETPDIGGPALGRIADAVIAAQSLDVDAVSGATASSRGILAAIGDAVGQ